MYRAKIELQLQSINADGQIQDRCLQSLAKALELSDTLDKVTVAKVGVEMYLQLAKVKEAKALFDEYLGALRDIPAV